MRFPLNRHRLWQVAADVAIVAAAWFLAWNLRFDSNWPRYYDRYLSLEIVALVVALKLPVFVVAGFYDRWWRYVSTRDMWGAIRGVAAASIGVFLVFTVFSVHSVRVPSGVWFIARGLFFLQPWVWLCLVPAAAIFFFGVTWGDKLDLENVLAEEKWARMKPLHDEVKKVLTLQSLAGKWAPGEPV